MMGSVDATFLGSKKLVDGGFTVRADRRALIDVTVISVVEITAVLGCRLRVANGNPRM
jgi:hypothetical protein